MTSSTPITKRWRTDSLAGRESFPSEAERDYESEDGLSRLPCRGKHRACELVAQNEASLIVARWRLEWKQKWDRMGGDRAGRDEIGRGEARGGWVRYSVTGWDRMSRAG